MPMCWGTVGGPIVVIFVLSEILEILVLYLAKSGEPWGGATDAIVFSEIWAIRVSSNTAGFVKDCFGTLFEIF